MNASRWLEGLFTPCWTAPSRTSMKTTLAEGIETDPAICGGEPRIAGTRITTEQIKRCFLAGWDIQWICQEFPTLSPQQVEGALRFEFTRRRT